MRFARIIWRCTTFAVVALLPACDAPSNAVASAAETPSLDVNFSGPLNEESVADIIRHFSGDTKRLVITSAGGEHAPSMRLGRAVRERNMTVVVRGFCLSACAHDVFAPAKAKLVEPNGIVGFHGTATARKELLEKSGRPDLAAFFSDAAEREQQFYSEASLEKELLVRPLIEVAPVCYRELRSEPSSAQDVAFLTRGTFFIPKRTTLENWGVSDVEGFWPEDEASFVRALATMPQHFNMVFRLEAVHGSFSDQLPRIEACPPDVSTR